MIVVGIDSATRSGWSVVRRAAGREELLEHGVIRLADTEAIEDLAQRLTSRYELTVAAIEDNYLDMEHKNVNTLKSLARRVGHWEHAFQSRGVETRLVMATIWQNGLLRGVPGMSPRAERDARKNAAKLWVRGLFKVDASEDACDAIGIGTWEARRRSFAELTERPR